MNELETTPAGVLEQRAAPAHHAIEAMVDMIPVAAIVARTKQIQEVMRLLMKPGTHYTEEKIDERTGKVLEKPSLLKPGAEVLLMTFKIVVDPVLEDLSDEHHIRYRCKASGKTSAGVLVGYGVGECSTAEEKYAYRAAHCTEEYEATPENRRRIHWVKHKDWDTGKVVVDRTEQVRRNPYDLGNTIEKMAKKRALVDLCLTALAASDCFTQDREELDGILDTDGGEGVVRQAARVPIKAPQKKKGAKLSDVAPTAEPAEGVTVGVAVAVSRIQHTHDGVSKPMFGVKIAEHWYNTFDVPIGERAHTFKNVNVSCAWSVQEIDGRKSRIIKDIQPAK